MKRSLLIGILALMMVFQGLSTSYAQRLLRKLYDDKETVRGGGKTITKKVVVAGGKETEYFYKNRSGLVPKKGCAYIQYYPDIDKMTIIINNKVTADVCLARVKSCTWCYTNDWYYEVMDRFILGKAKLTYKIVGYRADGMPCIELFACAGKKKTNINNWLNKYLRCKTYKFGNDRGPVWINRGPYKEACSSKWVRPRWDCCCGEKKKYKKCCTPPKVKVKKYKCMPCQGP